MLVEEVVVDQLLEEQVAVLLKMLEPQYNMEVLKSRVLLIQHLEIMAELALEEVEVEVEHNQFLMVELVVLVSQLFVIK